jgi:hypothetical protein
MRRFSRASELPDSDADSVANTVHGIAFRPYIENRSASSIIVALRDAKAISTPP